MKSRFLFVTHLIYVAALIGVLAVLCTSCAVRPPVRLPGEKLPCSARTIALLEKKTPELRSIKATIDVYLTAEESGYSQRFQVGLAAERPDRMRVNVYAGFSNLMSIAVDGDSLWVYLPSSSVLLAGSLDDAVSQALLPAATTVVLDAMRHVLFPGPLCATGCKSEQLEKDRCRFEEESGDGKRVAVVDSRTGRLLKLDLADKNGTECMAVDYRDYRKSGGVAFPHEITIFLPPDHVRARLVFQRTLLNREIDEKVFRLKEFPVATVGKLESFWK